MGKKMSAREKSLAKLDELFQTKTEAEILEMMSKFKDVKYEGPTLNEFLKSMNAQNKTKHAQAMKLMRDAETAYQTKDHEFFITIATQAFQLEKAAALETTAEAEPTRGVLFRSAASIALQINDFSGATEMITKGLEGPHLHTEIRAELEILKKIAEQKKQIKPPL